MRIAETGSPTATSAISKQDKRNVYSGALLGGRLVPTGEETPETVTPTNKSWPQIPYSQERESLRKAAESLNQEPAFLQRQLRFRVHEETGEVVVEVTNADTGKVMSTMPAQELLDLEARLKAQPDAAVPALVMNRRA